MPQQYSFNFNRRDPLTTRFEAVVRPAHVKPKPQRVLSIKIARAHPAINEGGGCSFSSFPISHRRARTSHPEISFGTWWHGLAFRVKQPRFVSLQQFPAATVNHFAFMVGHPHVQHLSRANPIEHWNTERVFPLFADLCRQRFTCRDA